MTTRTASLALIAAIAAISAFCTDIESALSLAALRIVTVATPRASMSVVTHWCSLKPFPHLLAVLDRR
jgi:hypothetical protein